MPSTPLSHRYDDWHRVQAQAEPASLAQWHVDALRLAPPLQGQSVLEVGCGRGDFAIHLAKSAAAVTAVDFSPEAVAIAQAKISDRPAAVEFQVADAQALPFADGRFDVVLSCECLEHLTNPPRGLSEMGRVLRPGGTLVLTTENYSNAMVVYWLMCWVRRRPFNSGAGIQPVEQFFLFWRVRRMMIEAGFRIEQMIGAHHVFLAVPGTHPHLFVRERIRHPGLARLLLPFARHMTFRARKR